MAFKLTYATMFNPPEEMHKGFDKAVAALKQNLGKEYGMFIDGKEEFANEKFEVRSPINTEWVLGRMQKGSAYHAQLGDPGSPPRSSRLGANSLADTRQAGPQGCGLDREAHL